MNCKIVVGSDKKYFFIIILNPESLARGPAGTIYRLLCCFFPELSSRNFCVCDCRSAGVFLAAERSQEELHAAVRKSFAVVNSSVSEGMSAAILEVCVFTSVSNDIRSGMDFVFFKYKIVWFLRLYYISVEIFFPNLWFFSPEGWDRNTTFRRNVYFMPCVARICPRNKFLPLGNVEFITFSIKIKCLADF